MQPVGNTQSDGGDRLNGAVWVQREGETPYDVGQCCTHLQHGKAVANAQPLAEAEGEVRPGPRYLMIVVLLKRLL